MYHAPTKRHQLIRQVAVYTAMSVTVVLAVTGLVFIMLGYAFNKTDGRIEQGGLLQFASSPAGADVTVDGNTLGGQTPLKVTSFTGSHFVTMHKTGYKTWQKSVDVLPGRILWLNYTRLIPTVLTPQPVVTFATVSSSAASPDNKWLAVKEDPTSPEIRLVNVSDKSTPVTTLTLPVTTYTPPSVSKTQSFSCETWDYDSRYILVKHSYNDTKVEWLIVDSQDVSKTKNITTLLDIDASKIVFHKTNNRIVFAQIGGDIRQIDLNAETLSRPLVSNVSEFDVATSSTLTYVTSYEPEKKTHSVGYFQIGADKPVVLESFIGENVPLHVAIGSYFNETYLAIHDGDTVNIVKGTLPKTTIDMSDMSIVASVKPIGGADRLAISHNGRFVVMQNANSYTVYDLELRRTTMVPLQSGAALTKELPWLDDYTVWNDNGGLVRLYEFDGANQQNIMPVAPGLSVMLSPDETFMYGINKTTNGAYQLERVQLIL